MIETPNTYKPRAGKVTRPPHYRASQQTYKDDGRAQCHIGKPIETKVCLCRVRGTLDCAIERACLDTIPPARDSSPPAPGWKSSPKPSDIMRRAAWPAGQGGGALQRQLRSSTGKETRAAPRGPGGAAAASDGRTSHPSCTRAVVFVGHEQPTPCTAPCRRHYDDR